MSNMTAEHFAGEMKSLVQTYVELRYPDDEEMQTALFENITSGKPSVSLEEIRDYVNTRSAWYAESFASDWWSMWRGNFQKSYDQAHAIDAIDECVKADNRGDMRLHEAMTAIQTIVNRTYGIGEPVGGYDAETFNAPYAGAGALMDITKDTSLGNFTSKELTESSAIHGDFDHASLNYSGHQNLEARAEDDPEWEDDDDEGPDISWDDHLGWIYASESFSAETSQNAIVLGTVGGEPALMAFIQGKEDANGFITGRIIGCDSEEEVITEAEKFRDAVGIERLKKATQSWEKNVKSHAESFSQWSQDEMNEPSHKGSKMQFDDWLDDEIESHGDIPLSEWGYEEEHDEPEHQHAESFNAEYPKYRVQKGVFITKTATNRAKLESDGWDMKATLYKPRKKGDWILQLTESHPTLGDRYRTEVKTFTDGINLFRKLSDFSSENYAESFNATRGIDTFAEPFEDLDDFYSGPKGAVKFVGLGVLVSIGIWMTKNKLLN